MRDILFRGKRIDNGKWVYGFYDGQQIRTYYDRNYKMLTTIDERTHAIIHSFHRVIAGTVGEYTGLTDKNGKRIFEGDILEFLDDDGEKSLYIVRWSDDYSGWATKSTNMKCDDETMDCWEHFRECHEVVGNIYENDNISELRGGYEA